MVSLLLGRGIVSKLDMEVRPILTICVIGRNEAKNLYHLIDSLSVLSNLSFVVEAIYVDSASSDNSAEIAGLFFDRVYVLEESDKLCASAGRYVGTNFACGDWILYLDGDMILCSEFAMLLNQICVKKAKQTGWVGLIRYIYNNGKVRENVHRYCGDGTIVKHFGGAVLLPRQLVIEAGNWNPSVFSNEEIELYTRIRSIGGHVCFADLPMIEHHTEYFPRWQVLIDVFVPGKRLGKKFFGFGQVIAARLKSQQLLSLVRYFPYPFIYWSGIFAAMILLIFGLHVLAVSAFLIALAYIYIVKGINFIPLYIAFLIQGLLGYSHYDAMYKPKVVKVINKNRL
jgi:glycosyltransferase involved in cell wall biosynthesis